MACGNSKNANQLLEILIHPALVLLNLLLLRKKAANSSF